MADSFKSRASIRLPRRVNVWDAVGHLTAYAQNVMSQLPGTTRRADFSFADNDGSTILRQDLADLESEVVRLRLKPKYVIGGVTLAAPGQSHWDGSVQVQVWGYFKGSPVRKQILIYTEAVDKIQMDGLRIQLENEARHLGNIKSRNPGALHEDTRSWLARTWRDHTAVFLVTVGGGLLVVLLALGLGLTP